MYVAVHVEDIPVSTTSSPAKVFAAMLEPTLVLKQVHKELAPLVHNITDLC